MDITQLLSNPYVKSIIIFAIFVVIAKLVGFIVKKILGKFVKKTKTKFDDILLGRADPVITFTIILLAARYVINKLDIMNILISRIIDSFIALIITYFAIILLDAIINVWARHWAKKSQSSVDTIIPLIHQFSKMMILLLGIFIILSEVWEKDLTGFFAGLGIAGIIIGFALKDSFSNIFGGISIILDKNYKVGDRIKVESGDTGIVYDISLRSTRIKNWDNELIIIPNGKMANSKIHNYVQPDVKARSVIEFGVAYGSDINKVKDVVLNTVKKIENVLEEPAPSVIFSEANDFSLDFKARFWVDDVSKRFKASEQARCMIHEALLKAGIKIPFPTRTIYMKK